MRRQATTLIEVLIAIFIMALGLVSLLTLFPLGAAQMARSIQDERAAQLAANSASYCRSYWKSLCEQSSAMPFSGTSQTGQLTYKMMYEVNAQTETNNMLMWFPFAMDDPNAGILNPANTVPPNAATANMATAQINSALLARQRRPSIPVFVDPIGWSTNGGLNAKKGLWLGVDIPSGETMTKFAIPRRTMCSMSWSASHATLQWLPMSKAQSIRSFALLDDMGFDNSGNALADERLGQYTCGWLLRRDQNSSRSDVCLTVVVYFRRSTESPSDEKTYMATPTVTTTAPLQFGNMVTLHYVPGDKPAIRKGGWILDATMDASAPQGFYYRVTDVGEERIVSGMMEVDLQLETPLRLGPAPGIKTRMFVVQDQILEVFEKGPLDMNSPTRTN